MKIQMTAKSDVGKVRKVNEDHCGLFEEDKLAVVCDGMGGHNAGEQASQLAVSTIRYMYTFLDQQTHFKIAVDLDDAYKEVAARLVSSIRLANRQIYNKAHKENQYKGMGTTISALVLKESVACICHVGDSRVYRFRDNELELLTEDHSWINELIQDNEIQKDEVSLFEKKNVITRALGLAPVVKIDLKLEPINVGDIFLLCSDGLTNGLSDDKLKHIISENRNDLDKAATELIDSANEADGSDNISVSLVKIIEKNSYDKTLLPASVTLKTESDAVSSLENKILRKELSNQNSFDKFINKANLIWEKKYPKIFAIAALLLITIIFVKYSFTDHGSEKIAAVFTEREMTDNIPSSGNNSSIPGDIKTNSKLQIITSQLPNNPDTSVTNDSLKNAITQNEKIYTKSLNKTYRNRGLIYLVGLDNLVKRQKTFLFLNKRLLGSTNDFFASGVPVRPGKYEIAIKDTNNTILYQYDNVWISAGDIKAIEFNQQHKLRTSSNNR